MSTELKNVVVLGLGPAGISTVSALAKSLPKTHRLVVIHKDTFSFYPVASLRAGTVPGWEKKVAFPIEQLFSASSRHVLLAGTTAVGLSDASVTVDKVNKGFGTEIPFDYAVIATGQTWAAHTHTPAGAKSLADIEAIYSKYQSEVAAASSILVVGAGATGIEAAGEFAEAHPSKTVSLVGAGPTFLPILKPAFSSTADRKLGELGVKVYHDSQPDTKGFTTGPIEKTTFDLGGGNTVEADYIFLAFGSSPNTGFIAQFKPELLNAKGLVTIKPTLQLATLDNVFAVGDANSVEEVKLAFNAGQQAGVAAANILSLIQDKAATKTWTPAAPAGLITIGSKAGSGLLFGWRTPSWFVALVKSGSLGTDKYKNQFATIAA